MQTKICSGQDLINSRDRSTCPTAPKVAQAENTPRCQAAHMQSREERVSGLASQLRGEDPESLLTPSATTKLLPDSYWTQLNNKIFGSQGRLGLPRNPHVLNTSYSNEDGYE